MKINIEVRTDEGREAVDFDFWCSDSFVLFDKKGIFFKIDSIHSTYFERLDSFLGRFRRALHPFDVTRRKGYVEEKKLKKIDD